MAPIGRSVEQRDEDGRFHPLCNRQDSRDEAGLPTEKVARNCAIPNGGQSRRLYVDAEPLVVTQNESGLSRREQPLQGIDVAPPHVARDALVVNARTPLP